ncbi:MAG: phosphoglycerate mutase [Sulfuricella sp.]|nr:phosphoglycerate mutase [Sulfuricella sp.]
MNCHLLIPGLLPPPQWIGAGLLRGMRLPALETLFGRGQKSLLPADGKEAWLCRAFGVSHPPLSPLPQAGEEANVKGADFDCDWPVASFSLLAEGGNPGNDFWLMAEPVHLQLQRNRMVLVDAGNLKISDEEATSLTAALNSHFADDGLAFFPTRPDRWHLRLTHPARLETHPLDTVIGRDVRNFLPGGADGGHWHGILNEIQMLLHSHPVNEKREQRGALPVNSIWPWGAGSLPKKLNPSYTRVWADDALARGLATAAGIPAGDAPTSIAEWLQQATPGTHLVVLDELRSAALYDDFPHWREGLIRLEKNWFHPLLRALARGNISGLALPVFGTSQAQILITHRADLWKIWRRSQPLNNFLKEYTS